MAKLGSKEKPAIVRVRSMERGKEIVKICNDNNWQVIVGIESDKPEDISDVERLMNPPEPVTKTATPGRNETCPCGSGKKYKHCCMK